MDFDVGLIPMANKINVHKLKMDKVPKNEKINKLLTINTL